MTGACSMAMPQTELTRQTMYDLVWSKPMTKVAEDFGISGVALKKHCKKHRVPTPPRGYWAKKEAGKPVRQTRLVETADPVEERIVIQGGIHTELPEAVQKILNDAKAARDMRRRAEPKEDFISAPLANSVHPAISATAKALRRHKPDKDDAVSATGPGQCGITVGITSVERCIAILDALARSCESAGMQLVPTGAAMTVASSGETVGFRLTEFVCREKHAPTLQELAAEDRRRRRMRNTWDASFNCVYPEWDFNRTGELKIEIENQYAGGLRRSWRDGKRQRLENVIDEVSAGLKAYAAAMKLRSEESTRWQRNWDRRGRRNARAKLRDEREEERRTILDQLVGITTEANKLRAWLDESKKWPGRSTKDEFERFVGWARSRLSYLEHAIEPDGIAERLRSHDLFPETDPLIDPPDDLIEE